MEKKKTEVISVVDDDDNEEDAEDAEDYEIFKAASAAGLLTVVSQSSVGGGSGRVESPIVIRSCTIIDFLNDVWIPIYSAVKNLRLIVGFLSKKIATPLNERRSECAEIRSVVADLLAQWTLEGPLDVSCSKETMQQYLVEYRSKKLDANKADPLLTRDIPRDRTLFVKLKSDYDDYLKQLFGQMGVCGGLKRTMPDDNEEEEEGTSRSDDKKKNLPKRMKRKDENTDVLFDSSIFADGEKQRVEDKLNRVQQFMTKLESDGNLCTWRTPGEIDNTLIRIEVYNFKDIAQKEKRTWWKSARLRTQFLTQESCPVQLTELLNQVATRMSKISGLTTEKRSVSI